MSQPKAEPEVLIRIEGRAGRITLNRPQALNALTLDMVRHIWDALIAWQDDSAVELVLLDGTGERALCAGGDIRSIYDSRADGSGFARAFWSEEYRLNALIHRYPKPYVAIQDGIVMGGGVGLSSHARYRVVTERAMLAMPETGIGLIPDVGGTWILAHAPGELGTYLGLTGARMTASDAIQTGFSSTFMPSAGLAELKGRLVDGAGCAVDEIIEAVENEHAVPASPLMVLKPEIDRIFAGDSIEEIMQALNTTTADWAQKARKDLTEKSPLALKVTLAALRQARALPSLEAALDVEYRLCTRLFERGEFPEGVRALIVDKDKSPKWNPSRIEEVTPGLVAELLSPFPPREELGLAKR